jgi:hypothetical protein
MAFAADLPTDRVKIETDEHGFAFLSRLTAGGPTLEYAQADARDLLHHKYKLANVPEGRWPALIADHVAARWNLCLYFHPKENRLFCFNLDNNRREDNTAVHPEMLGAVAALEAALNSVGHRPLIVASGRGFHVWGRFDRPAANPQIHRFMLTAAAQAVAAVHRAGWGPAQIKFNLYPHPESIDVVSLRLFGSRHTKTGQFSRVLGGGGLLSEAASWTAFEQSLGRASPLPSPWGLEGPHLAAEAPVHLALAASQP